MTRGSYKSPYRNIFSVLLFAIAIILVCTAVVQVYLARYISTEFQESGFIIKVLLSMFQSSIILLPVIVLNSQTRAYYAAFVTAIFITSMAILLFIFLPKMIFMYKGM